MKALHPHTIFKFTSIILLILLISCASVTNSATDTANWEKLNTLIDSKSYEIENNWLNPAGGAQINLIGNPNHIRIINNDSVSIYLPYFGVRRRGYAFNGQAGIKTDAKLKSYKITKDTTKKRIQINFETTSDNTESLKFNLNIYGNGNVITNVTSTDRDFISYQGIIQELSTLPKE